MRSPAPERWGVRRRANDRRRAVSSWKRFGVRAKPGPIRRHDGIPRLKRLIFRRYPLQRAWKNPAAIMRVRLRRFANYSASIGCAELIDVKELSRSAAFVPPPSAYPLSLCASMGYRSDKGVRRPLSASLLMSSNRTDIPRA